MVIERSKKTFVGNIAARAADSILRAGRMTQ